jgi:hypothetical protein
MQGKTHPACSDITLWGRDRREEMLAALETSYRVWNACKDISIDAFRASEAVAVPLKKIRSAEEKLKSETTVCKFTATPEDLLLFLSSFSARITLILAKASIPSVESLEISLQQVTSASADPYSLSLSFSEMVASPGAIDWVCYCSWVFRVISKLMIFLGRI